MRLMPDRFDYLGTHDRVMATTTAGDIELQEEPHGGGWSAKGISVRLHEAVTDEMMVDVEESADPIYHVTLEWSTSSENLFMLGDAWERAYGDLDWRTCGEAEVVSPWYFLARPAKATGAADHWIVGVKTGGAALASWHIKAPKLQLKLDLRSGNRALRFDGNRRLLAATIVTKKCDGGKATAYQKALRALCDHPRLAKQPMYGVNDWYYAYGNNTAGGILDDSKRAADWASGLHNRPFSVIDDGWSATEGTWSHGNARFPDMPGLAHEISKAGCKPGLWVRPLLSDEKLPAEWFMAPKTLDPSRPDALEKIHETIYRIHTWGYELIKHDYSTFDICGRWGFQMTDGIAGPRRTFADDTGPPRRSFARYTRRFGTRREVPLFLAATRSAIWRRGWKKPSGSVTTRAARSGRER